MLAAATLAVIVHARLMLPALQSAFSLALESSIEKRLASDVTTLISAARVEDGRLVMPNQLPGRAIQPHRQPLARLHL
jgi:two-component system sensor histidine kinase PhoQ